MITENKKTKEEEQSNTSTTSISFVEEAEQRGNIGSAFFWMMFLSILLSWAPAVGPVIAGYVGGKKAGSVGRAILAALIPTIIMLILSYTILIQILGTLLGGILGSAIGIYIFLHSSVLILGAVLGGWSASKSFIPKVRTESKISSSSRISAASNNFTQNPIQNTFDQPPVNRHPPNGSNFRNVERIRVRKSQK